MPHFDQAFMVHVDANDVAVGAILTQKHNETDMLICYFGKQLNPMEAQWGIHEREMYAIIQALGKW